MAPPVRCGEMGGEWKLARIDGIKTEILAKDLWENWVAGNQFWLTTDGKEVQVYGRISPFENGLTLFVEGNEYELYLASADDRGCFYLHKDRGLVFYRYLGSSEAVYLRVLGGWVALNPKGGVVRQ
jgi:hypothetical protein